MEGTAHLTPIHQMAWLIERQERSGFRILEKTDETRLLPSGTTHQGKQHHGDRYELSVRDHNHRWRGLPLLVMVTPASLTDRDAAREVLFRLRLMHPEITIVRADSTYAGKLVDGAKKHLNLTLKTVSRPKDASGFIVLPRRWVVERSLAWMMHARRHARDYERLVQHSETLITWARIGQPLPDVRPQAYA